MENFWTSYARNPAVFVAMIQLQRQLTSEPQRLAMANLIQALAKSPQTNGLFRYAVDATESNTHSETN